MPVSVGRMTVDRETRERKAVGASGGWFGRSTVVTRKRVELIILLTPRIVPGRDGAAAMHETGYGFTEKPFGLTQDPKYL
jgi:hypothetical protein